MVTLKDVPPEVSPIPPAMPPLAQSPVLPVKPKLPQATLPFGELLAIALRATAWSALTSTPIFVAIELPAKLTFMPTLLLLSAVLSVRLMFRPLVVLADDVLLTVIVWL